MVGADQTLQSEWLICKLLGSSRWRSSGLHSWEHVSTGHSFEIENQFWRKKQQGDTQGSWGGVTFHVKSLTNCHSRPVLASTAVGSNATHTKRSQLARARLNYPYICFRKVNTLRKISAPFGLRSSVNLAMFARTPSIERRPRNDTKCRYIPHTWCHRILPFCYPVSHKKTAYVHQSVMFCIRLHVGSTLSYTYSTNCIEFRIKIRPPTFLQRVRLCTLHCCFCRSAHQNKRFIKGQNCGYIFLDVSHHHMLRVAPVMAPGALNVTPHHGKVAQGTTGRGFRALCAPGRGTRGPGAPAAATDREQPERGRRRQSIDQPCKRRCSLKVSMGVGRKNERIMETDSELKWR